MPEIPLWVKSPDYDRVNIHFAYFIWLIQYVYSEKKYLIIVYAVENALNMQVDWLNKFLSEMWPFMEKVFL